MYTVNEFRKFQRFYSSLNDSRSRFYIYFSTGLLFWFFKCKSFLPPNLQIIVIAAGLNQDEKSALEQYCDDPKFYIDKPCTDRDIWKLLFDINTARYGWIDIDCFIFDTSVFDSMTKLKDSTFANSYQTVKKGEADFEVLLTPFLYINTTACFEIKKQMPGLTPDRYSYETCYKGIESRVIPSEWYPRIEKILPINTYLYDEPDLLWPPFFDTLQLYQIMAMTMGYTVDTIMTEKASAEVLHLGNSILYSFDQLKRGDGNMVTQQLKDHLNRHHFTRNNVSMDNIKNISKLIVAYALLSEYKNDLPSCYNLTNRMVKITLLNFGIGSDQFEKFLQKEIMKHPYIGESFEKLKLRWE